VIGALVRADAARVFRSRTAWLTCAAWCALALGAALLARHDGVSHGADRVLLGAYGALALPLAAYSIVGAAVGGGSLSASVEPFVRLGAAPVRAALSSTAVTACACAAFGALLGAAVAAVAHGVADPPLARDAALSAYAGALGGAAYAAWFVAGAAFGKRGGGRATLLLLDWVVGAGQSGAALLVPRAHLRNMLGGLPPVDFSQRASAAALIVLVLACALVGARRA
jgi:hypothetical protein